MCSLGNGQNAVYAWIPEDTPPGTEVEELPIEGEVGTEMRLRLVQGAENFRLEAAEKKLYLETGLDRDGPSGTRRLKATVECASLMPGDEDFRVNISVQLPAVK